MSSGLIKLHVGGLERKEGWSILNIQEQPGVDYVGTCVDLSFLGDGSCAEVYASHVLEHLSYQEEQQLALQEIYRVLAPGGRLRVSVPNLRTLCTAFLDPQLTFQEQINVMRIMFGGQMDDYDFHFSGLWPELVDTLLTEAGFTGLNAVEKFGEFKDTSEMIYAGVPVSYNVEAFK